MSAELAAGGVIKPTGALVGLGTDGPEVVIPLNPIARDGRQVGADLLSAPDKYDVESHKNTIGYKVGYYFLGPLVMLALTASSIRLIASAITGQ